MLQCKTTTHPVSQPAIAIHTHTSIRSNSMERKRKTKNSLTLRCNSHNFFYYTLTRISSHKIMDVLCTHLMFSYFFSSSLFHAFAISSLSQCAARFFFTSLHFPGDDDDDVFIYFFILTACRPCDRNLRDAELISCRLRRVEPLCRLPGSALQQLAMCGFYEDLEKGITCEYCYV